MIPYDIRSDGGGPAGYVSAIERLTMVQEVMEFTIKNIAKARELLLNSRTLFLCKRSIVRL